MKPFNLKNTITEVYTIYVHLLKTCFYCKYFQQHHQKMFFLDMIQDIYVTLEYNT